MTPRSTSPIVVVLLVLLSFAGLPSGTQAQQGREVADTGVITLGPNQVLRISVTAADVNGDNVITIRFRRIGYQSKTTANGISVTAIAAENTSPAVTLAAREAASVDIPPAFLGGIYVGVRGMVLSNNRDVKVIAEIVDTTTGNIIAILIG